MNVSTEQRPLIWFVGLQRQQGRYYVLSFFFFFKLLLTSFVLLVLFYRYICGDHACIPCSLAMRL